MTATLATELRKQMVKALVQRAIFCPISGNVLDTRTCVVLNDVDGDPLLVLAPEGWASIAENVKAQYTLVQRGIAVDLNTVLPK